MNTGERLSELRKGHGLSQEELAERLGVTRQSVYRWENGGATPSGKNLRMIAECYQIPVEDLMEDLSSAPDPVQEEPEQKTENPETEENPEIVQEGGDEGSEPQESKFWTLPVRIIAALLALALGIWIYFQMYPVVYKAVHHIVPWNKLDSEPVDPNDIVRFDFEPHEGGFLDE